MGLVSATFGAADGPTAIPPPPPPPTPPPPLPLPMLIAALLDAPVKLLPPMIILVGLMLPLLTPTLPLKSLKPGCACEFKKIRVCIGIVVVVVVVFVVVLVVIFVVVNVVIFAKVSTLLITPSLDISTSSTMRTELSENPFTACVAAQLYRKIIFDSITVRSCDRKFLSTTAYCDDYAENTYSIKWPSGHQCIRVKVRDISLIYIAVDLDKESTIHDERQMKFAALQNANTRPIHDKERPIHDICGMQPTSRERMD
ncbi:hypothetical protein GQX74_002727 [Glossina fuscipes]|nr:hypothetical protein GQX74_002727 [Glossina fuscipes]